ncbi:MAG: family 43 glycosylhydrolase, partial [Oscillospiraceae bacterium]|nr:family 43 glycosylhydrolase [Oscillospiraceae bacterium]
MKRLLSHKIPAELLAVVLVVTMVFSPLLAFAQLQAPGSAAAPEVLADYVLTAFYDMSLDGAALNDVSGNNYDAPLTGLTAADVANVEGDDVLTFPSSTGERYAKIPNGVIYDENFAIEVTYNAARSNANSLLWNLGTRRAVNTQPQTLNNYLNFHPNVDSQVRVALKDSALFDATGTADAVKSFSGGTVAATTGNDFTTVLVVFEEGAVTAYQDGEVIGSLTSDYSIQDILDTGVSNPSDAIGYIGRAFSTTNAASSNFQGKLTSFKIYNKTFTDADALAKAVAELQIPNAGDVRGHITLPASGRNGVQITWASSDEGVVNTRWKENDDYDDTPPGVVTRPTSGDANVTLTATLTRGALSDTKVFPLTVRQAPAPAGAADHYLFTHFTGDEGNANSEQVYFATSKDGLNFRDLSAVNDPILTSTVGERGVRDMCMIRSPEGDKFYLIATDLSIYHRARGWGTGNNASATGSQKIVVWESDDLVHWSAPRLARVAADAAGMAWAPEAFYDEKTGEYITFFSSTMNGRTQVYYAKTRDFYTFTETKPFVEHTDVIDATVAQIGDYYYRASKFDGNSSSNIFLQRVSKEAGMLGAWSNYISLAGSKNSTVYAGIGSATNYYASGGPALEGPEFYRLGGTGEWILMADRYGNGSGYVPFLLSDPEDPSTWAAMASGFNYGAVKKRHGNIIPVTQAEYMRIMEAYTDGHVTAVTLGEDEVSTYVGTTKRLSAALTPADPIDADLTWSSSDPQVATVDAAGLVTALAAGETTVTVTTVDGGLTDTCLVTVAAAPPPAVPLAYFDFNSPAVSNVYSSLEGTDAKATAQGASATYLTLRAKGTGYDADDTALYLAGSTASAARGAFLRVTNLAGNPLLTGLEEITVSYDASPSKTGTNWPVYLARSASANSESTLAYVGFFNTSNATVTTIERFNNGTRYSPSASASNGALNAWHHIDCVLTATETKLYVNGVLRSTVPAVAAQSLTSILGTASIFQIGRAQWGTNGEFFNGLMDNVAVYGRELTPIEIRDNYYTVASSTAIASLLSADVEALHIADVAVSDLSLPAAGANGSKITWASGDEDVMGADGAVTRPEGSNAQVKLTATLTLAGQEATKEFTVLVLAEGDRATLDFLAGDYDLGIAYVTGDITLAATLGLGTAVTWTSAPEGFIGADGAVTRPAAGAGDRAVTLTAAVALGAATVTKDFDVTVAEADHGKLLAYTHPAPASSDFAYNTAQGARFAAAAGGDPYAVLNSGKPVMYSKVGSKRMIWPSVVRKPDGGFALIAADNNASSAVTVYDSADLTKFTGERLVPLNTTSTNVREVAAVYDNGVRAYRVVWRGTGSAYYETVTDLAGSIVSVTPIAQAEHAAALTKAGYVGGTFAYPTAAGTQGSAIGLTKAEYDKVLNKFARIKNTGVEAFGPVGVDGVDELGDLALPERATLKYSDGSTKTLPVAWDQGDLDAIDRPGTYEIDGTILQKTYGDPFISYRADPWVTKGSDGYYYFTASYPMVGSSDATGYDRIVLRRSRTLEGLAEVGQNQKENTGGEGEIVIWNQAGSTTNHRYVWAPEIHEIKGKWYV